MSGFMKRHLGSCFCFYIQPILRCCFDQHVRPGQLHPSVSHISVSWEGGWLFSVQRNSVSGGSYRSDTVWNLKPEQWGFCIVILRSMTLCNRMLGIRLSPCLILCHALVNSCQHGHSYHTIIRSHTHQPWTNQSDLLMLTV